jgi:hypothetical protein
MSNRLIFISYSHDDEKWKKDLEVQLGLLEQGGNIKLWSESNIGTGEDWKTKINDALQNACVAILVITPSYLNPDFVLKEELAYLLTRKDKAGLRIFPIIVEECSWEMVDWLRNMKVRPHDRKPMQAKKPSQRATEFKKIVAEVAEIVGKVVSSSMPDRSESSFEHPDVATPTAQKASSDDIKTLQERKARIVRELQDVERQISVSQESTSGSGGAQPSAAASGYRPSPANIPDQTPLPTEKVYEKRKAN